MKNIYILVFIFSFLKYGKTEITKEDMQLLENNILEAISHLSWKIDGVSSKVTNIEERIVILEPQIGITENVVDDINEKISLIPRETKQIVTSIDQMTISVIDSVVTGLNILRQNRSLEDKEGYTKITEHFEGINSTLNSLEIKIGKDFENVTKEITSRTYNVETNIGIKMKEEITPIKKAVDIAYNAIHPKVVNINSEVALIKSSINTIQPKVVKINSDIAVIKSSINTIQPKVVNINSKVANVKKNISQILCLMRSKNCADLYKKKGYKSSEPVQIFPYTCSPHDSVSVICDQDWTIIQRRQDVQPRENFYRPWADYVQGFGKLKEEFWLGLDHINKITSDTRNELYIELEDWEANTRWAKYSHFEVGSAEDKYRLTVTGYSGDAGDALRGHNGQEFSTYDQDNDAWSNNCAERCKGGWWYKDCHDANLNGLPDRGTDTTPAEGINWLQWRDHDYSLRAVTMKIRPQVN